MSEPDSSDDSVLSLNLSCPASIEDAPPRERSSPEDDCLLVAQVEGRAVGSLGIMHERPQVGRISSVRMENAGLQHSVLSRLLNRLHLHCWNRGYLKLLVDPRVVPRAVQQALERHGFHLVRRKRHASGDMLEYLVDLYSGPLSAESGDHRKG